MFRKNTSWAHRLSQLNAHLVWAVRPDHMPLTGDMQMRCRIQLIQLCEAEAVKILMGVVSKDHVHLHLAYPPAISINQLVNRLKRKSARKLQRKFPELKQGLHRRSFWVADYACWSNGNVTDDMLKVYLAQHQKSNEDDHSNFVLA